MIIFLSVSGDKGEPLKGKIEAVNYLEESFTRE